MEFEMQIDGYGDNKDDEEKRTKNDNSLSVRDMTSKEYYNDKFARFFLHEILLKDHSRTYTFYQSMMLNKHLFKDKLVLDLGSGTGILSLFAAKAGAKHVFAIECSQIAELSKDVVKTNKREKDITILHDKLENVEKLPRNAEKVDIIISDWMGYCLLHDSMVSTLITARDKWLKPGGMIFPDKCSLYICAVEDDQYIANTVNWWSDVYGFDMTCMHDLSIREPTINAVDPEKIITSICLLQEFDAYSIKPDSVDFSAPFYLKCLQCDNVQALVIYFDAEFTKCHTPVSFSTSPDSPYTHWKQTIFYLKRPITVQEGEELHGVVCMKQSRHDKGLYITIDVEFDGQNTQFKDTLHYKMS